MVRTTATRRTDRRTSPVIVVGMHRSGTSVVAEILRQMGVFIGWELENNNEAVFFLKRNERILRSCNGGWDNPLPVKNMLDVPEMRSKVIELLMEDMQSINALSYLGPRLYLRHRSIFHLDIPWGWKDPRNTILLSIWLGIFPDAKVVHVYRNGIDSGESLYVRERRRIRRLLGDKDHLQDRANRQMSIVKKRGVLQYLLQNARHILNNSQFDSYDRFSVRSCATREGAFLLWHTYVMFTREVLKSVTNVINIKYEELLLNPTTEVSRLAQFCGITHTNVDSVTKSLNKERAYAFVKNRELYAFYIAHQNDPMMVELGYSDI